MFTIIISRYKNILNFDNNIGFRLNDERQFLLNKILKYYLRNPHLTK